MEQSIIEALTKEVQELKSTFVKEVQELKSAFAKEVQELKSELKKDSEFDTMRPKEAMQILGLSRTTFDKYKKEGVIPCTNVGGKVLVDAKTVHKLKKQGFFRDSK